MMLIPNSASLLLALGVVAVAGEFNPNQVCNVCGSANEQHYPNVMLTGIKIDGKTQVTCAELYSYTKQVTAEQMDVCENIQRRYKSRCCDDGTITPAMVMELIDAMALNDKLSRSSNMSPSTRGSTSTSATTSNPRGSCYLCQGGVAVVLSSPQSAATLTGGMTCSTLQAQLPNWYAENRIDEVECGRQQARFSSVCCPPGAVLDGSNPVGNVQEAYFNQLSQQQQQQTPTRGIVQPTMPTTGYRSTSKGKSSGASAYSAYSGSVYTPLSSRNIPQTINQNPYATMNTEYSTFTGNAQQFNSLPTSTTSTVTASGGIFTVTQIEPTVLPVPASGQFSGFSGGGGKRKRRHRRRA